MLHKHISQLKDVGSEIMYNDPITGEVVSGLIGRIDREGGNVAFVYIISPYDDENDKIEPIDEKSVFKYKDIMVFDEFGEEMEGWMRDPIKAYMK